MIRNKKILITGATGFIGANLVRYCIKKGIKPTIVLGKKSDVWRIKDLLNQTAPVLLDLSNKKEVIKKIEKLKPSIIFHTSVYGVYKFQNDEQKLLKANVMGILNLISACKKSGCEAIINTGASSEYGIKSQPMNEKDVPEPTTLYGVMKAATTLFCQMKAKYEDMPIVTLRLFSPYGYYENISRLIPTVMIQCVKGQAPKLSSPNNVRDFVFIEDVMEAYFKAAENINKVKGEILNIAFGKQYAVKQVVDLVNQLSGREFKPMWNCVPCKGIEPKMWSGDILKAKYLLGWKPRYDLRNGLKITLDWFRENISLYKNKS